MQTVQISALAQELARSAGVSETDAEKVLSTLGLDDRVGATLSALSAEGFEQLTLGDLRISAKLGSVVVAR